MKPAQVLAFETHASPLVQTELDASIAESGDAESILRGKNYPVQALDSCAGKDLTQM